MSIHKRATKSPLKIPLNPPKTSPINHHTSKSGSGWEPGCQTTSIKNIQT